MAGTSVFIKERLDAYADRIAELEQQLAKKDDRIKYLRTALTGLVIRCQEHLDRERQNADKD